MAKCDLSIELDDADRTYAGGEKVCGTVRVRADKDVNCSGLQIRTYWATHGRGNVDSKEVQSETLFSGQWLAGEQTEYRFELSVADWPPTYHGHHLNVDHYVEARAKIPWGFDPKTSAPFRVRPIKESETFGHRPKAIEIKGPIAAFVGIGMIAVFLVVAFIVSANIGWFLFPFLLIVPMAVGIFIVTRFLLPAWALGDVVCEFETERVAPGQQVRGELTIQPKKNVSINQIILVLSAQERCVSGSGTNRTTHRHNVLDQSFTIAEATSLRPNEKRRFPLTIEIPVNAPYSLSLDDNDLVWSANVRIDIPRWPDWRRTFPLSVIPSAESVDARTIGAMDPEPVRTTAVSPEPEGGEITFAETVGHLWAVRQDREQTKRLVDAVTGLTFDLQASIERRLLYSGDDDPHLFKGGHAIWAHFPDPELPMVLYIPRDLADEFEQIGREVWAGRGTVVGWDHRHGRLQVRIEI